MTAPQRMLFVSRQVGVDAKGYVGKDVGEQVKIAVANLNAVLAEAGWTIVIWRRSRST